MLVTFDFAYISNHSFNEFVEKIGKYYSTGGCDYRSYCNNAITVLAIHAAITHDDAYLAQLKKTYRHNSSFNVSHYKIPRHSDYKFKKDLLKTVSRSIFAYVYIASTLDLDFDKIFKKCLNGEYNASMFDCDTTEVVKIDGTIALDDVKNFIWIDLLPNYGFNIVQTLYMMYSIYNVKYDGIGVVNSREFGDFKGYVLNMANSLRKLDERTLSDYSKLVAKVSSTFYNNSDERTNSFSGINPIISQLLMNNVCSMVCSKSSPHADSTTANISMLTDLPASMWLSGVNSSISNELFALADEYFAACSRIMDNHIKTAVNSVHDLYDRDFLTTSTVEYAGYYNKYNWNIPSIFNPRVQKVMWATVRMVKNIKNVTELELIARNSTIKHFEHILLDSKLSDSMLDKLSGKMLYWLIKYYIVTVWSTILQYDVNSVGVFKRALHAGKLKLNIIFKKLQNSNNSEWETIITRYSNNLQHAVKKQPNSGWLGTGMLDNMLCDGLEGLRKNNKTIYNNVTERLYVD